MLKYISLNDHIDKLNFSPRTYNALLAHGILTLQNLLTYNDKLLGRIKNLGKKSIQEVLDKVIEIQSPESEYIILEEKSSSNPYERNEKYFIDLKGKEYSDIPLHELGFSIRTYNCFKRENLLFLSKFYDISSDKLKKIPNFGSKSLLEVEDCKKKYTIVCKENANQTPTEKLLSEIYEEIANDTFFQVEELLFDEIQLIAEQDFLDFKSKIYSSEIVKDYVKKYIVFYFQQFIYGSDNIEKLLAIMPTCFANSLFIENLLAELLHEKKLILFNNKCYMPDYSSCALGAIDVLSAREYKIFLGRISGQTLEEVGKEFGLTRQGVALTENKILEKLNKSEKIFQEDIYKQIFLTYDIQEEDFITTLGDKQTYNYLYVRYKKRGKTPLEEILSDSTVPELFKRKLEKVIYRDYVYIGNSRIKCSRSELIDYAIRTFANNPISFDEFKELYEILLIDINKEDEEKLQLSGRGFENNLIRRNVLTSLGRKFRHYNFINYDFALLIEELNIEHISNLRYSSLKFFREHPDLMQLYDMRNEYELHNLLKRICEEKYPHIDFRRMPNIDFGNVDFDEQILNLLFTLAPISKNKFAEEFEKEYGIKASSLIATSLEQCNVYAHAGVYEVDHPVIPQEYYKQFSSKLVEDFYTRSQLEEIFINLFPYQDFKYLNSYSIKALGYKLYSNYIISNKYESATEYANLLLTVSNIIDLSSVPQEVKYMAPYQIELAKLKHKYEVIEFYPQKLINIRKLNEAGITKTSLANYRNEILRQIKDNSYFTIHSLRKQGIEHELDELGFDDWFYASILIEDREHIKYQKFTRNRLLYKGKADVKVADFIEDIIEETGKSNIEIYELLELIKDNYNLTYDIYKIRSIVADSSLYYDQVSSKIYLDYNTYFKEI